MTTHEENGCHYVASAGNSSTIYPVNNNYIVGSFPPYYWSKFRFVNSSVCCQTCFFILSGTSKLVHSTPGVYSYDYQKCTSPYLNVCINKQIIHNLIVNIKECKNPFEEFDNLFKQYFSVDAPNLVKLYQFRFFERIFLRVLTMELGLSVLTEPKNIINLAHLDKTMSQTTGSSTGASHLIHHNRTSQTNVDVSFKGDLHPIFSSIAKSGEQDFDTFSLSLIHI